MLLAVETALPRVWTLVAVSITNDNNNCTTSASYVYISIVRQAVFYIYQSTTVARCDKNFFFKIWTYPRPGSNLSLFATTKIIQPLTSLLSENRLTREKYSNGFGKITLCNFHVLVKRMQLAKKKKAKLWQFFFPQNIFFKLL